MSAKQKPHSIFKIFIAVLNVLVLSWVVFHLFVLPGLGSAEDIIAFAILPYTFVVLAVLMLVDIVLLVKRMKRLQQNSQSRIITIIAMCFVAALLLASLLIVFASLVGRSNGGRSASLAQVEKEIVACNVRDINHHGDTLSIGLRSEDTPGSMDWIQTDTAHFEALVVAVNKNKNHCEEVTMTASGEDYISVSEAIKGIQACEFEDIQIPNRYYKDDMIELRRAQEISQQGVEIYHTSKLELKYQHQIIAAANDVRAVCPDLLLANHNDF